eukprot:g56.t1
MSGGEGSSSYQRLLEENSQPSEERVENSSSEIGPDIPIEVETPFEGRNRLKEAITAKDGDLVGQILDEIERRSILFKEAAFMMTECFGELFDCYKNHIKKMLFDNVLCWPVGTARVPLDIFQKSKLEIYRSWTCDLEPESLVAHLEKKQETLASYVEDKILYRVKNEVGLELIDAKIGCFCVKNACFSGLEGIIRPLLLRNVENSIFKSELLKWAITRKLSYDGNKNIFGVQRESIYQYYFNYAIRIIFIGGLFSYIPYMVLVGLNSGKLRNMSTSWQVLTAIVHLITCSFVAGTTKGDFIAMKRQCEDYRLILDSSHITSIIRLATKYETIIDVLHAVLFLIIIPLLHCGTYISDSFCPWLVVAITLGMFVFAEKLSCFGARFQQSTSMDTTKLIYHVLKRILPFGFALFRTKALLVLEVSVVFYVLSNYEHKLDDRNEEEETNDEEDARTNTLIHDTFSNYWRVLFNVISAFFGTFDPEVYLHSGPFSAWIIVIFVVFIFSQMVVFFNVLISWIGQQFEEYLNSIEEIALMEIAKFSNTIEASMSEMELQRFKSHTGRYLYVLYPAEEIEQEEISWKGRVKTIVENTKMVVKKSNKAVETQMDRLGKRMDRLEENVKIFQQKTNDTLEKILTKLESL